MRGLWTYLPPAGAPDILGSPGAGRMGERREHLEGTEENWPSVDQSDSFKIAALAPRTEEAPRPRLLPSNPPRDSVLGGMQLPPPTTLSRLSFSSLRAALIPRAANPVIVGRTNKGCFQHLFLLPAARGLLCP